MVSDLLADSKRVRNTCVPSCYTETSDCVVSFATIRQQVSGINTKCDERFNNDPNAFNINECATRHYQIPVVEGFLHNWSGRDDFVVSFYDVPGLDDKVFGSTVFEWVRQEAKNFDIVLYVDTFLDIINHDSEKLLVRFFENLVHSKSDSDCIRQKFCFIPVINKIENIEFDTEDYEQFNKDLIGANQMLNRVYDRLNVDRSLCQQFLPMSALGAFVYRRVTSTDTWAEIDNESQRFLSENYATKVVYNSKKTPEERQDYYLSEIKPNVEQQSRHILSQSGYNDLMQMMTSYLNSSQSEMVTIEKTQQFRTVLSAVTTLSDFIQQAVRCITEAETVRSRYGDAPVLTLSSILYERFREFTSEFEESIQSTNVNNFTDGEAAEYRTKINLFMAHLSDAQAVFNFITVPNERLDTLQVHLNTMTKYCRELFSRLHQSILFEHEFNHEQAHSLENLIPLFSQLYETGNHSMVEQFIEKRFLDLSPKNYQNPNFVNSRSSVYFNGSTYLEGLVQFFIENPLPSNNMMLYRLLKTRLVIIEDGEYYRFDQSDKRIELFNCIWCLSQIHRKQILYSTFQFYG